ncbi:MAG: hypothetical protein RMJ33_04345 [Saprospiraceae bacterium]|nr:hypothetical protein [Saprospiraceae bacterium]MDW8229047.1 hypothetical protein [Saprospiraceae bacterium]
MQKSLLPALLLFAVSLFLVQCGKDNPQPESSDVWVVTKFVDLKPGTDQTFNDDTQRFAGYSFEFQSGDLLVVRQPNGSLKEGKWRRHTNDTKLSIGMENPPALLDEIVGTWDVELYSATSIKLVNPNAPTPGSVVDFGKQAVRIEFTKQ